MPHPLLYEINTRCWLRELSDRAGRPISLADVPPAEFRRWQELGSTHIWLMGVWTTGPRSRAEGLAHADLRRSYSEALPDWKDEDVIGSPYAIAAYEVPAALGGERGLLEFRRQLQARGMKLVLDFVPNHLGLDHAWLRERPDIFVQNAGEIPGVFRQETTAGVRWLAHGKDPYFAPWTDTVQVDYRRADARTAMMELLLSVARRCDGVRCDMAMLMLNDVFHHTWSGFPVLPDAGSAPDKGSSKAGSQNSEFWSDAVLNVKTAIPGFLFLAEVYWGLEPRLRSLGFDFTYDKVLYDRLAGRDNAGVPAHVLGLPADVLSTGAHFLENHDEPRIAPMLSPAEHRAAALVILGLPGMRFLHEGQLAGAQRRVPVQLGRRFAENSQPGIERLYQELLSALAKSVVGRGNGQLLSPRAAWPDNPTAQKFVIVQWQAKGSDLGFDLVAVNLAPHRGQCYVPLCVPKLSEHNWSMKDLLGSESYQRNGEDLRSQGLYLDMDAHGAQLFHFEPIG
jgi:hypothetical protein